MSPSTRQRPNPNPYINPNSTPNINPNSTPNINPNSTHNNNIEPDSDPDSDCFVGSCKEGKVAERRQDS